MKRIWLLVGIAALSGCGARHYDRTPVVALVDPATPHYQPVPLPPPAVDPPPANVDPLPRPVEAGTTPVETTPTESEVISAVNGQLEDVFFAYDHFDLSPEAATAVRRDAELLRVILREFPALQITVEGHCDERGSAEYNLGLGDRRAARAIASLNQLGVPASNFTPVSYGKEAPQCTEATEPCWSRNRRAHFVVRTPPTE
jgi:peptidoglycan-associated lipoprotein